MATLEDNIGRLSIIGNDGDELSEQPPMDEAKEKKKNPDVFPFFKLPRELRNKIYAEATTNIWMPLELSSFRRDHTDIDSALFEYALCPHLRQVCRQFTREYEEEMALSSTDAKLTIPWWYLSSLSDDYFGYLCDGVEDALSRVQHLVVTYSYNVLRLSEFDEIRENVLPANVMSTVREIWDVGLAIQPRFVKGTLRLMPLLKRLDFVRVGSFDVLINGDGAQGSPSKFGYQPKDFEVANIRRVFSADGCPLHPDIEVISSVVLVDRLFIVEKDSPLESFNKHWLNRIVYNAPEHFTSANLKVDALETHTFEEVEEDVRLDSDRDEVGLMRWRRNVWTAGHRVKFIREEWDTRRALWRI